MKLESYIRDVADWPKPGINFKDITPVMLDPAALAMAVEQMVNPFRSDHIDIVAGAESRGFIFGTALARELSAGFVPFRKPGKLPWKTHSTQYALEYGTDRLEIHQDAVQPGQRVLLADDLLATGGTMEACCRLIEKLGGIIVGITFLIELEFLPGRSKLTGYSDRIHSVIRY